MAEITLCIQDAPDPQGETRALYEAITEDGRLRQGRKELRAEPGEIGDMGAGEVISFATENKDVLLAMASCISAWLATRRSKLTVVLRGHGREATVNAEGVGVANEEAVRQALEIVGADSDGSAP